MESDLSATTAAQAFTAPAESDPVPDESGIPPEGCLPPAAPPLVRIREEHNISRRDIDEDALKVLYRLVRSNYTAYLVGGGVRDLLLGRKPKDFDISTNAKPEEIRALFRNCILIGRRFRLAHIRYGDKIIETSTFRRSPAPSADPTDPEADLFQRDDNLFGTPQEDALRRDFTVNGLFYDINSFSIIDYVGGMEDLAKRRIRSIGDPCIRFREDPIRMIRAVRFASRLGFELDPDTYDAIVRHGEELAKASPARLLEEITRLFAFSAGEKAVRLLQDTGMLKVILPEVSAALEHEHIDTDLFWRRLRTLDEGDTVLPDATPALVFSTLLLDSLKLRLGRDWPSDEFPRFKYDKIHAFLEPLSQRLRFPRKLVDRIIHVYLDQHRFAHTGGRRGSLAGFVTKESFHEALALAEIVQTASGKLRTGLNLWRDMLAERIYGREDGRGDGDRRHSHQQAQPQHHQQQQQQAQPPAQPQNGAIQLETPEDSDALETVRLDEPPQGKRLSRSARRRRNKKLRRIRHDEQQRADTIDNLPPPAADTAAATAEPIAPAVVAPAAPVESVPAAAPAQSETAAPHEEKQKPSRGRNRRDRSRKRDKAPEARPSAPEPKREAEAEPAADETPFQPLTAAAFYAPPPAPEKEKKGKAGGKGRQSRSKKAKAKDGEQPAAGDSAVPPPPPSMDKADEANLPMHWLDEI